MNKIKKGLILFLSFAFMLIFAGCGGKLSTKLDIKDGFTGSRKMTYTLDLDNQTGFNPMMGNVNVITADVKLNCPSEMTFTDRSTPDRVIYDFEINFQSEEEYRTKVKAILDAGKVQGISPLLEHSVPESVFASGVKYKENFTSEDLLKWFENLLNDKRYLNATNAKYLYGEGQTGDFTIYGKKSTNTTHAEVDSTDYLPLNGVDIYTTINNDGTYNRRIETKIPASSMSQKEEEIKEYMEGVTHSSASGTWLEEDGESIHVIEIDGADIETINNVMNAYCSTVSEKRLSALDGTGLSVGGTMVFSDTRRITESFALDNYATGAKQYLKFRYFVAKKGDYIGTVKGKSGEKELVKTIDGTEWYRLFDSEYETAFTLDYEYTYKYNLSDAKIELKPGNGKRVQRKVELTYTDSLSSIQLGSLKTRIQMALERADDYATNNNVRAELTLKKCENTGEGLKVILVSSAPQSVEAELWNKAFKASNKLSVKSSIKSFLCLIRTTEVEDRFDLSVFGEGRIPGMTYTVKGIGNTVKSGADPDCRKGNNYVEEYSDFRMGNALIHKLTGRKVNPPALVILIVVILSVLAAAGIFGLKYWRKLKMKNDEAVVPGSVLLTAMQPGFKLSDLPNEISEPTEESQSMAPRAFCTQCGAPIGGGRLFCTSCGFKIPTQEE